MCAALPYTQCLIARFRGFGHFPPTLFFRNERSCPPVGGPDRVNTFRFPKRPSAGKAHIQNLLFRVNNFISSALRIPPKARLPGGRRLPSPCARTSLPSGCAASMQPGTSVPCVCFCLSHVASQRVLERGMLFCRYLHRQDGPPPPPTRALGSRTSLDRFAVSRAVRGDQWRP